MVRLLAFTDPHGKLESLQEILRLARTERPDLVLCSGDLTFFGEDFDQFLNGLKALERAVYWVPGNHETPSAARRLQILFPYLENMEYRLLELGGIRLAGLPGTDAFWPGARPDEGLLAKAVAMGQIGDCGKPLILLTHYPPTGTQVSGISVMTPDSGGSRLVRQIVEALSPALVLCGHYHQDFGKEAHLGSSWLVNPGPNGRILQVQ